MFTRRSVRIEVSGSRLGLTHRHLDQSAGGEKGIARQEIGVFRFSPERSDQFVRISNHGSNGNVSFQAIELTLVSQTNDTGSDDRIVISAEDDRIRLAGSWTRNESQGIVSFEDKDAGKGNRCW